MNKQVLSEVEYPVMCLQAISLSFHELHIQILYLSFHALLVFLSICGHSLYIKEISSLSVT